MPQHLYYRDNYGRRRENRRRDHRPGRPAKPFLIALAVLAAIILLANLPSSWHALMP